MSENESKKSKKPHIPYEVATRLVDEAVASSNGVLTREDKTGWVKVTNTLSKNRVYVQLRDEVREVHLSGWGKQYPGTEPYPKQNGKVEAWIDMSSEDPAAVLADVLSALAAQEAPPAPSKKERASKAPTARSAPRKPTSDADRLAAIKRRAEELGMASSFNGNGREGASPDPTALEEAVDQVVADLA